jgi:hypothetical protein
MSKSLKDSCGDGWTNSNDTEIATVFGPCLTIDSMCLSGAECGIWCPRLTCVRTGHLSTERFRQSR